MEKTLGELARLLGGRLEGPPDRTVTGAAGIAEADAHQVTFLANPRYEAYVRETRAGAVLVQSKWSGETGTALIRVPDPYRAFAQVLEIFYPKEVVPLGISAQAYVDESAVVGRDVSVHPFAYVGPGARIGDRVTLHPFAYVGSDASVGDECVLYPHVSVLERCVLGNRVIAHSGVVIGSDGFGYAPGAQGHLKVPQVGIVQIDDDVEIGANCTIDRATTGKTWIQRGVKIDNLVQVAHNVVVGEHTVLVAQVGISGSTRIGKFVLVGGQAGFVGHITVGDYARVAAQSGVTRSVDTGSAVGGTPAMPHQSFLRAGVLLPKLSDMVKRINKLERRIEALETAADRG